MFTILFIYYIYLFLLILSKLKMRVNKEPQTDVNHCIYCNALNHASACTLPQSARAFATVSASLWWWLSLLLLILALIFTSEAQSRCVWLHCFDSYTSYSVKPPANRNGHIFLPIFNLPCELATPDFSAHAWNFFSVRIPFNASCSLFVFQLVSRVLKFGVNSNNGF